MQTQKTTTTRRKHDAGFKTEVLKMLASGQTPACVANALGISKNIIYRWKRINQVGKKSEVLTGDLVVENQQLKERLRQGETGRDVLKKALSIFSRAT